MDKNQPTNPQPQAPDYGEPWKVGVYYFDIATRDFSPVAEVGWKKYEYRDRIIACVNACAGIPSEDLTPSRVKKGIALAKLVEAGDPEVFLTLHELALRRNIQCKECLDSVRCDTSGEEINNEWPLYKETKPNDKTRLR